MLDSGTVNVRDGLAPHDATNTPLQFVYQAADCRLWYTKAMTLDVRALWEAAADVAWRGGRCVVGGIGKGKRATTPVARERREELGVSAEQLAMLEESMRLYTDLRVKNVAGDGHVRPA